MYQSLEELLKLTEENQTPLWETILVEDMKESGKTWEETFLRMEAMYEAMKLSDSSYEGDLRSPSKKAGGAGKLLEEYRKAGNTRLCGEYLARVVEKAVKMGESNACMKRIVAAPTAGSCGVIPAVLLAYEDYIGAAREELVKALFVAAGVGNVIAQNASIAGASGGCQAEIGSAAAMAAGALCYLEGGSPKQIMESVALSLKNMLGLACDPVGGLVEVPCIKRNAYGASNAVVSVQLALAGVESAIAPDEVITTMKHIGDDMPKCIKETGDGGLAVTASAKRYLEYLQKN